MSCLLFFHVTFRISILIETEHVPTTPSRRGCGRRFWPFLLPFVRGRLNLLPPPPPYPIHSIRSDPLPASNIDLREILQKCEMESTRVRWVWGVIFEISIITPRVLYQSIRFFFRNFPDKCFFVFQLWPLPRFFLYISPFIKQWMKINFVYLWY